MSLKQLAGKENQIRRPQSIECGPRGCVWLGKGREKGDGMVPMGRRRVSVFSYQGCIP